MYDCIMSIAIGNAVDDAINSRDDRITPKLAFVDEG